MHAHVLTGSKQEIAENLTRLTGEVREAIVFIDEPVPASSGRPATDAEDIFAEMRPLMVETPGVDDSRESIYAPMDGE